MSKKDAELVYDFEFSDGLQGNIDKHAVSIREYLHFWTPKCTMAESFEILSKASGLTVEQVGGLPMDEYQALCRVFQRKCVSPLDDPKK